MPTRLNDTQGLARPELKERLRLMRAFCTFPQYQFVFQHQDIDFSVVDDDSLRGAIEYARLQDHVFGHRNFYVEKDSAQLLWRVYVTEPAYGERTLLQHSWARAFVWHPLLHLQTAGHAFAALEACVATEPLTDADLEQLERVNPGITQRLPFVLPGESETWEPDEARPPGDDAPAPSPAPQVDQTARRTLSLDRKLRI